MAQGLPHVREIGERLALAGCFLVILVSFACYQHDVVAIVWIGYDNPRKLGDRETGGGLSLPVWIDYMSVALKGKPEAELSVTAPEGVVHIGSEWFYEEYTQRSGVSSVGLEHSTPKPPGSDERKSILDMVSR